MSSSLWTEEHPEKLWQKIRRGGDDSQNLHSTAPCTKFCVHRMWFRELLTNVVYKSPRTSRITYSFITLFVADTKSQRRRSYVRRFPVPWKQEIVDRCLFPVHIELDQNNSDILPWAREKVNINVFMRRRKKTCGTWCMKWVTKKLRRTLWCPSRVYHEV